MLKLMIQNNLFEEIIEKNIFDTQELNIISGYASANFLEKVLSMNSHLKINLYIGMALDGISHYNHDKYRALSDSNKNINVYYLVNHPFNHMKIYEFLKENEKVVYSGSANFSENGFFKNIENLFEVEYKLDECIDNLNYMHCLDEKIERYVPLVNMEYEDLLYSKHVKSLNGNRKEEQNFIQKANRKEHQKILLKIKNSKRYMYEDKICFDILLENDSLWNTRGINSGFNQSNSGVFISNNKNRIKDFFNNREDTFFVHTKYNERYTAHLTKDSRRGLELLDGSLYDFIRRELKLAEVRPISYNDLLDAGSTKVTIVKIDEDNYSMFYGELN
ncbi:NgoFVII family restriction endonuclease [Macrococcoides caseolyticum subsp. hominis]|uniref:phospholipase D family protein n=1 Tax=Macrococcoides caseolyticum TaxID=69966 RepID=UPI000C156F57|nr:phospholipase D family protein [Macrococcus caseolyticus]RAI79981.1 NgoFVII family restriction endonuclease [Macrococcus caseolyticus subsp. hominis]